MYRIVRSFSCGLYMKIFLFFVEKSFLFYIIYIEYIFTLSAIYIYIKIEVITKTAFNFI